MSRNINGNRGHSKTKAAEFPFQLSDKPEGLLTGDDQFAVIHGRGDLWAPGTAPLQVLARARRKNGVLDYGDRTYPAFHPEDPRRHRPGDWHCTIGLFKYEPVLQPGGRWKLFRREHDVVQINCIFIDDVGTKIPFDVFDWFTVKPHLIIETSWKNYQVVWLTSPLSGRLRLEYVKSCIQAMIDAKLTDCADQLNRVLKRALAINEKPGRDNFPVRIVWADERILNILAAGGDRRDISKAQVDEPVEAILTRFGLNPDRIKPIPIASAGRGTVRIKSKAGVVAGGGPLTLEDMDFGGYDDHLLEWLVVNGWVVGPISGTGFFPIICPFHNDPELEHTTGDDTAGYSPAQPWGLHGAFSCFHRHYIQRGDRTPDFINKFKELGYVDPSEQAKKSFQTLMGGFHVKW